MYKLIETEPEDGKYKVKYLPTQAEWDLYVDKGTYIIGCLFVRRTITFEYLKNNFLIVTN